MYVTTFRSNLGQPGSAIIRSDDAGETWTVLDVTAVTGDRIVRIAAIDPVDPQNVFFRVTGVDDAIGLTTDGGATVTLPLVTKTQLTAFLRRANGQILVSGLDVVDGVLYRSLDGGRSFAPLATRLGIRALAERAGKLYVATDNVVDGFALAVSADDGATFQPLLRFDQVKGARGCSNLVATCAAICSALVNVGTFTPATCAGAAPGPDGAAGGDGGGNRDGAPEPAPPGKGCACQSPAFAEPSLVTALGWMLVAALTRRRRR